MDHFSENFFFIKKKIFLIDNMSLITDKMKKIKKKNQIY